jgi:hypothetical protein
MNPRFEAEVWAMHTRSSKALNWPHILAALRTCTGATVVIRDGKVTQPADAVRSRPAAKGTELCLFSGENAVARLDLIQHLETLAKGPGRRFMSSARASVNDSFLLIDGVRDEEIEGSVVAVINTRRPTLGFGQDQQSGDRTTLRSKRIKNG